MKVIVAAAIMSLLLGHAVPAPKPAPTERPIKLALVCMKTGEKVSGMNKICYYDCLGSEAAITIGSTQLCPLTINR